MSKKNYNGYKSFQYLEAGLDYKPFRLAKEINRVEPYVVEVSEEEEALVQKILDEEIVVSPSTTIPLSFPRIPGKFSTTSGRAAATPPMRPSAFPTLTFSLRISSTALP